MRFEVNTANAATAHLDEGNHLAFDGDFLRDHKLGAPFPPFRWREAFLPRLLTRRLLFFNREAWESETIDLSGNLPHSHFHPISVPEGKAYWVKLRYLAAFSMGTGGCFTTSRRWHDPVAWLIGTTHSVLVHGPAELLFYGEGLTKSDKQSIHADLVVAFDASVPFRVTGYDPGQARTAHIMNAMSSTVVMVFEGGGPLLQTTIRRQRRQRFRAICRVVISLAVGALALKLILG